MILLSKRMLPFDPVSPDVSLQSLKRRVEEGEQLGPPAEGRETEEDKELKAEIRTFGCWCVFGATGLSVWLFFLHPFFPKVA